MWVDIKHYLPAGSQQLLAWSPIFLLVAELMGCSLPNLLPHAVTSLGEGYLITAANCANCAAIDPEVVIAKRFCASKGRRFWPLNATLAPDRAEKKTLVFYCESNREAQDPLEQCYGRTVEFARAKLKSPLLSEVEKQVFPRIDKVSINRSHDHRFVNKHASRQIKALTPVYETCVTKSYAANAGGLDQLKGRHFSARVDLLKALAAGDISYASYAAKLKMLQSQLSAGVFY